ncbi:MAG: hypothetical protein F6K36_20910 [Symploca sp. SIO3C6]|uniref:SPOR domain-containing protein n=1 Tax=Symploca sp. SIO1C4 TaxID=2607765 RepID=A0A6B3N829_9CYAN|nr:hypothetical protein [Symploca sp. SIO3C6]NER27787.1 hypothetical protein [Symploca sp. SIO1C4]
MTRVFQLFRHQITLINAITGPALLLIESVVFSIVAPAIAQTPPEQRIFGEELPPPSPPSIPTLTFPASPLPTALPSNPNNEREFNFQAPNPPAIPRMPTQPPNLYRVEVFGDNSLLLSQVQQLESEAFIRRREGVIQAGVFADKFKAQSLARSLISQGFQARVTEVNFTASTDVINSNNPNNSREIFRRRSYFVVIPGNQRDLPDITAQVVQLGVARYIVTQRSSPRGTHVAVGPFSAREEANRWSSYLQSSGLDARVYFGN